MLFKKAENENAVLEVLYDESAESPRTLYDNFGKMICWHRHYILGDEHDYSDPRQFMEYLAEDYMDYEVIDEMDDTELYEAVQQHVLILPIYAYEHGNIMLRTSGFACRWDSGQVGFVYATHADIIKEYGTLDIEKATTLLTGEVDEFSEYVQGNVYGFILKKKVYFKKEYLEDGYEDDTDFELEDVESCWGFIGSEYLEDAIRDYVPSEYRDLIQELKYA